MSVFFRLTPLVFSAASADSSLSGDARGHTLRLLYGKNPGDPDASLTLNSITNGGNFSIAKNGIKLEIDENLLWGGDTLRRDGRELLAASYRNTVVEIEYNIIGLNSADLFRVQKQLHRYGTEVKEWELRRKGAPVWLEFRWADGLKDVPAPVWGEFSHYYRVKHLKLSYPDDLLQGIESGVIERATLRLECEPFARGLNQQLLVNGYLPTNDELSADWTIGGWRTHSAADYTIFEYYIDSDNHLRLWHDLTAGEIKLEIEDTGSTTTTSYAHSRSEGDYCHFMVVNADTAGTTVYLDGSSIITGTDFSNSAGELYFGYSYSAILDTPNTATHDSWRIWKTTLTAGQIGQMDGMERQAKAAGDLIAPLPYFETIPGDGIFTGDIDVPDVANYGIAYNIPGTAPAMAEYRIEPPTTSPSRVYWLGVAAYDDEPAAIDGVLYEDNPTVGIDFPYGGWSEAYFDITDVDTLRGRWQVLCDIQVTGASMYSTPFVSFGSSTRIYFQQNLISDESTSRMRNLGDITIDWPMDETPSVVRVGVYNTDAEATDPTTAGAIDWIQLIPYPNIRAEAQKSSLTIAAGDTLYIRDNYGYVLDASDSDSQLQRFDVTGYPINLQPGKYNYVIMMMGEDGVAFDKTKQATVGVWITPRYTLPGGLV